MFFEYLHTPNYPEFGVWSNGRNTLSQMTYNSSLFNKGKYTHSFQLELSLKLRDLLVSNQELCINFLNAIMSSWYQHINMLNA